MSIQLACRWCRRPFTQPGVRRHCEGTPWCDWCLACVEAKRRAGGVGSELGG